MRQLEKIWSILKEKKTKSDFFEISAIVSKIEDMLAEERSQGMQDAIECLQVSSKHNEAVELIRAVTNVTNTSK